MSKIQRAPIGSSVWQDYQDCGIDKLYETGERKCRSESALDVRYWNQGCTSLYYDVREDQTSPFLRCRPYCSPGEYVWLARYCGSDVREYRCTGENGNIIEERFIDRGCEDPGDDNAYCYVNPGFWQYYDTCDLEQGYSYRCAPDKDWVQRQFVDKGCRNGSCYDDSGAWEDYEECGVDYYEPWSDEYCEAGDVYRKTIFHNKGCADEACFHTTSTIEELVEDCLYGCLDGRCLPGADNLQTGDGRYCTSFKKQGEIELRWVYHDQHGDFQQKYQIEIAADSGFSNIVTSFEGFQSLSDGDIGTSILYVYPGAQTTSRERDVDYRGPGSFYYWRLRVQNTNNNDWSYPVYAPNSEKFDTPWHAYPYPDWYFTPDVIRIDEPLSTTNISECYNISHEVVECNRWNWSVNPGVKTQDYDYIEGDHNSKEPVFVFFSKGDYAITLRVSDDLSHSCDMTLDTVYVGLPLPKWREIMPYW